MTKTIDRNQLILKYYPQAVSLSRKFNNGRVDEDLVQEALLKGITTIDWCIANDVLDDKQIDKLVYVAMRNRVVDLFRKHTTITMDDFIFVDIQDDNLDLCISDIEGSLNTDSEKQVFKLLLEGKTRKEIVEQTDLTTEQVAYRCRKIKQLIKDHEKA